MASESSDLKIAVQESDAWNRRLSIIVPAERVKRTRGAVAQQMIRSARLPGFRKGKLPTSLIERQFGASIDQETVDRTIQEAYREAIESSELAPISQGKVENVEYKRGEELKFDVELEVQAEIELARTSGFQLSRPAAEVGESELDGVLERLRDERAVWDPLAEDEKAGPGDQVMVEITALSDEDASDDEPRGYRFVIGEGQAIPEVEESILTLTPGGEGDFIIHFPDDFPDEERRGQEQQLRIKLTEAGHKRLAELDDEFAKTIGDFEDMEAAKASILEGLRTEAEQRADAEVRRELIDRIIDANPFTVPVSMVEKYLEYMTGHTHDPAKPHQHTPEQEEQLAKVKETVRPQAEWSLKRMLIVERIAESEGLQATQDEIDSRVEELAGQHDRSPSEVWLELEKSGQLEMLERDITEQKVFEHLLSQSTVA